VVGCEKKYVHQVDVGVTPITPNLLNSW